MWDKGKNVAGGLRGLLRNLAHCHFTRFSQNGLAIWGSRKILGSSAFGRALLTFSEFVRNDALRRPTHPLLRRLARILGVRIARDDAAWVSWRGLLLASGRHLHACPWIRVPRSSRQRSGTG